MDGKSLKTFMDLGFTLKEAKIYLAVLELGEGTVQEIAKKSGVKRTSIYFILEDLKRSGVVFETKAKKHTYYLAEDPEILLKKYQNRIERFAKNLESLNTIKHRSSKRARVFLFDGSEGFKKIWEMILKPDTKEFLIMTDPREMLGFVRKGYITGKVIKEKVRLGIKSRQIIASSEYAKEIIAKDRFENRISKILPHIYKIPFTTIILENRVALISSIQENMILIIESGEYAKTQKSIFETLWDLLPATK